MLKTLVPLAALLACLVPQAAAQKMLVNPAANATVEGNSRWAGPFGGNSDTRVQQICSTKGNAGVIRQVAFRRDNDVIVASLDYVAFSIDFDLTLSTSPTTALAMDWTFANNIGPDAKMVHTGTVNWPAEKKVPPGPTGFVYTIPLAAPYFIYTGTGDLCMDFVRRKSAAGNTNSLFFMDADSSAGGVGYGSLKLGEGCPGAGKSEVYVYDNLWLPGAKARILLWKAPSAVPALFLVGTSSAFFGPVPLPFDLGPIGAPGCPLYTNIVATTAGTTSTSATAYNSRWEQYLGLPADPALSGAKVPVQYLLLNDSLIMNPAMLSVSQGWEVTIGTAIPGMPHQSEAHGTLTAAQASLVQVGYGMVVEFMM